MEINRLNHLAMSLSSNRSLIDPRQQPFYLLHSSEGKWQMKCFIEIDCIGSVKIERYAKQSLVR
jgi:hypothetical protein